MIVTLKEYDKLLIKDQRDLSKHIISQNDAITLQSIIRDGEPVFKWGYKRLVAQHWVGSIALPDFTIEILPKLYGFVSENDLRAVLTRMLLISHQAPSVRRMPGMNEMKPHSLMEMLIDTFVSSLENYTKEGVLHSYQKVKKNTDCIKGQILFNKHFTKNILDPVHFWCRYSVFEADNPLNRFFKLCLLEMNRISGDQYNRKRIKYCLSMFSEIGIINKEQALNYKINFNSVNSRAEEPYYYGRLFLESVYSTLSAGKVSINTMLFDMNDLFQLFVYKVAKFAFGASVSYQVRGHYMVRRIKDDKKLISLRPDIIIKNKDGTVSIIDTKWKIPVAFSKESDIYQMNAYSTGIKNVKKVYLLYPYIQKISFIGDYEFDDELGNVRPLGVRVVDLVGCLNWKQFILDFKVLFD